MKIKIFSLFILFIMIAGCASQPLSRTVTMIGKDKEFYVGRIDRTDSGFILNMQNGPNGEKFTGTYVVVDRTAYSRSQGGIMVPVGNQLPAVGSASSSSSGRVDARGYWYAKGDKESTMKCELQVGLELHGQGTCRHSNGSEYEITF